MIVSRTANEHRAIDEIDHAKWGYFGKSALAYRMAVEIRAEDHRSRTKLVDRLAEFEAAVVEFCASDVP